MQTTTDNGQVETPSARDVYDFLAEAELTAEQRARLSTLCPRIGCSECDEVRATVYLEVRREPEEVEDQLTETNLGDPTADGGGPDFNETEGMTLVEIERVSMLEDQLAEAQRELAELRGQADANDVELRAQTELVRTVQAERDELQRKQDNFVEVLHGEADSRGWCSEYDDIMERVGLPRRMRYYTAYVSVTLTFQTARFLARDAEQAEATLSDAYILNHLRSNARNVGYGGSENPQVDDWEIENVEEVDE